LIIVFRFYTEISSLLKLLVNRILKMVLSIMDLAFQIFAKVVAMIARSWYNNIGPSRRGKLHSWELIFFSFIFRDLGQGRGGSQSMKWCLLLLKMLGQLLMLG
jgi:hypothetical protein